MTQRLEQNDEQGQQRQVGYQCDQHGHTGQQAEVNSRDEVRQDEDREAQGHGYRGVVNGPPDAAVAALDGVSARGEDL